MKGTFSEDVGDTPPDPGGSTFAPHQRVPEALFFQIIRPTYAHTVFSLTYL